jgi:capsular polysaccharide biosynthesis protein
MKHRVDAGRVTWGFLGRWWLILLLTLASAGAGYAAASKMSPVYRAQGSVLVGQPFGAANPGKEYIEASQQLAQAYADIATRQPVLEGVIDDLGLPLTWNDLRNQISIEIPPDNLQLIEVAVEAGNPKVAERILDQLLNRILQLSSVDSQLEAQGIQGFIRSRLKRLQGDIRQRQREIDELERELSAAAPAEIPGLQRSIEAKQDLVIQWQSNYSALLDFLGAGASPNDLEILETSETQATPVRPDVPLYTALAGAAGLFAGLALAYALEFRRERRFLGEVASARNTGDVAFSGVEASPSVSSARNGLDESPTEQGEGWLTDPDDRPDPSVLPARQNERRETVPDQSDPDAAIVRGTGSRSR